MRAALTIAVLGLAAGLLSGCGGDGDGQNAAAVTSTTTSTSAPATRDSAEQPEAEGLAGTWQPINESPIATLTITDATARTTGQLACPGAIADADSAKPVLTLECATPNEERKRGTLALKPDGSALVITWDGPSWGGAIDSFKRAG
ncbi:hypothetical protein ADK67_03165 [Saccharothrix sp. NRRL B-16348]|uniref:hypothetical protein n=1 Tax=Saccharothrix sp. NRRL B-16348 TaxID=1415542 RepID=UPI0006AF884A|nr:hypothetical protein [Saccharothrix sp. NRRL B-16348]KOX34753.1 hypothetical protein ADK67_03165 [Saccharothrix sp. NRRL B-16348]